MKTKETNQTRTGDIQSVAQDAEDLMDAATEESGEKLAELRARLSAAMESAKVAADRLQEKTIEAARATDRCIRDHPYQTLGVAFGLGALIGLLIGRRRG